MVGMVTMGSTSAGLGAGGRDEEESATSCDLSVGTSVCERETLMHLRLMLSRNRTIFCTFSYLKQEFNGTHTLCTMQCTEIDVNATPSDYSENYYIRVQ